MSDVAKSPRSFKDDWSDQDYDIGQLDENPESLSWPELGDAATCERVDDQTSLMIPAQVRSLQPPHFSAHIVRAARLSSSLDSSLRKLTTTFGRQKSFHNFVQAYFISPDSVLRIWTRRNANVCQEFSKSRLWASKSYFAHFWDNPADQQYSTLAYIDYGGNGLVRTVCHVLESPREGTKFPRGQFFGIVCMDFKLPDDQLRLMRQHLFFETALVTFPFPEGSDLEPLSVEVRPQPDEPTGGDKVPNTPHEVATAAAIPADGKSTSSVG